MEKKNILIAFSFQILILFFAFLPMLIYERQNDSQLMGFAMGRALAICSAIIVCILLFFLRNQELKWWHTLLISFGSIITIFFLDLIIISGIASYYLVTGPSYSELMQNVTNSSLR